MLQIDSAEFGLELEILDDVDAPMTDMEWGVLAGLALAGGFYVGAAIAT